MWLVTNVNLLWPPLLPSRPLCFTANLSLFCFLFCHTILEVAQPPNIATYSVVTQIYKIWSEIWGAHPENLADQKRQKFGAISDNFVT